jgi:DNA-binding transcriptional LysR family regulator
MDLEASRLFAKVIQLGSFSSAALALKLPVSTVSRAVGRLEAGLGAKLILRTTRRLSTTSAGQAYFERVVGHLQALEDAQRDLLGLDQSPGGKVRITATEDFGNHILGPVLASLIRDNPSLQIEFLFTDEQVDLIGGGFDLAVRIGKLSNNRFRARKVGEIPAVCAASPNYLKRRTAIRQPKDLEDHDLLFFAGKDSVQKGNFQSEGAPAKIKRAPRVLGNNMGTLLSLAREGAGVAVVPLVICQPDFLSGKLVRVLPQWEANRFPVSLVSPNPDAMPARVKAVADRMAEALKAALAAGQAR